MRSTSDPTQTWRRRERSALALGLAALASSVGWAIRPLPRTRPVHATLSASEVANAALAPTQQLDRAAFAAHIWNPPPQAQAVAAAPAPMERPAPSPRLELIGIVHETAKDGAPLLRAALYDPDADKLHLVATGETVGATTVAEIDTRGVVLQLGGRDCRLDLRADRGGGG